MRVGGRYAMLGLLAGGLMGCGGATRGTSQVKEEPPGAGGSAGIGIDGGGSPDAAGVQALDRDVPRSGSRIQVTGWSAGGEWINQTSVRDTERGVDCEVRLAADGKQRCLPLERGNMLFQDPECTKPALQAPAESCDGSRDRYATYPELTTCAEPRMFVVGYGELFTAPTELFDMSAGGCYPTVVSPGQSFFEAIESPPEDWVVYERRVHELTPALAVETWEGADGSALWGGFLLLPDDVACEPLVASGPTIPGAEHRCVPKARATRASGGYYVDAECHEGSVTTSPDCSAPVLVEHQPSSTSVCGSSPSPFFEVGRELSRSEIYWMLKGPCEPANPDWLVGYRYFLPGAPVDVGRYPAIALEARSWGPVRPYVWSAGGVELGGPDYTAQVDAEGTYCSVQRFADGKLRCATSDAVGSYFADPTCQTPLHGILASCSVPEPPRWVHEYGSTDACGDVVITRVRAVGAEHRGAVYEHSFIDDACLRSSFGFDPSIVPRFFTLGAEVDAAELFPEVVEVVR